MNPFIVSLAIRLTILLLAGGLIAVTVRRSTHAMRHVVIAATLACVVALPAMMALVPEWRVGVLPSAPVLESIITSTPVRAAVPAAAPSARESIRPVLVTSQLQPAASPTLGAAAATIEEQPFARAVRALTAPQIMLAIWLAGVLFGLAWIAVGRIGLARVRRGATQLRSYEWRTILESEAMHAGVARRVELFTSPAVSMPVTWGVLSPVIVLPEASLAWTHDRKRVVVMHEMAHIARRDSATQLVATFACVAYWLHPLVLVAARRLRAECERACDERVLERGTPAAEYAAHLLDVARFSRSFGAASIVSVAMARPSQLEGRLLAVLRAEPRPARMTARTRALAALSAAAMLLVISAFKPVVREVHSRTTVRTSLAPRVIAQATVESVMVVPKVERTRASVLASTVAASVTPRVTSAVAIAFAAPALFTVPVSPVAPVVSVLATKPDSVFQKSVPVHADGTLELDLDTGGDVEIIGTDDSKVVVDGSLGGRDWRQTNVELEGQGGDARLASRYVGSSSTQMFDNAFKIRVPKKFNVRLTSSGGNFSISGVEGRFSGSTAGGKIEIDHASGEANLSTGGGDVRISNSHLDGAVATGGGTVNFEDVTGGIAGGSGSDPRMYGGFNFAWPKMPQMPKMPAMAKIDLSSMERSRAEMEREQGLMERSQMLMDSARIIIELNRGKMDTANIVMRRELGPLKYKYDLDTLKYDMGSMKYKKEEAGAEREALNESLEALQDSNKVIIIDKSGGSIHVLRAPKGARLSTGGGSIAVGRALGVVSARTGGGNISIDEADDEARVATGSGDITIIAGKGDAHPVDVRSGSGNIDVMLPQGANVTLDLEAAYTESFGRQAKITGDFPLETTVTPNWDSSQGTPRKYVRVKQKIGKGGPLIRVRTVNGDIRLREES
jgi:beta-lactamase regulating signal transducer with metallopeptidase domain